MDDQLRIAVRNVLQKYQEWREDDSLGLAESIILLDEAADILSKVLDNSGALEV